MAQHTNEEVTSGFYQLTEKLFPQSQDQVLIASHLSQFRSGHGIFGRPVAKAAASSLPAYQWWLNFGASVPELQSLAIKVLSQTASSSEAERNWEFIWLYTEQTPMQLAVRNVRQDRLYPRKYKTH